MQYRHPLPTTFSSTSILLLLWCLSLSFSVLAAPTAAQQVPTEAVGKSSAVNDEATPPSASLLHLVFALHAQSSGQITDFVGSLTDPSSPNFHKWLKPGEFGERFGASNQDINAVASYLDRLGLQNIKVWPDRLFITADTTRAQAESAFNVSIRGYNRDRSSVDFGLSPTYYAPDKSPTVDQAVAGRLVGIFGLSNSVESRPTAQLSQSTPLASPAGYLDPIDLTKAYDISSLHNFGLEGQGVTIAIFSPTAFQQSDITRYLSYNNITSAKINIINVNGGNTSLADQVEACIDIETVVGQAPAATVKVYEGPNDGSFNIFEQMETDDPDIVSESYRIDEDEVNSAYASAYESVRQAMAAEGITIFVASGDDGAYGAAGAPTVTSSVDAASNYVTAVGGTELTLNNDAWNGEIAWTYDDGTTSGNSGSGGGLSVYYPQQAWQTGPGVSNSSSDGMRQIPDVAALASKPYYDVSTEGSFSGWAGTSCSTPLWASCIALIEQNLGTRLGNIDPTLYSLGANDPTVYHDITSGNNGAYYCTTGWDFVTGWGSADFGKLFTGFGGVPTAVTSFTPTSGVVGTPVTITGTNLANASVIAFGGGAASTIVSDTPTNIVVDVPTGASTGAISVVTPRGSGASSSNFTVLVPNFNVSSQPTTVSVPQGFTGSTTISLNNANGFSGIVSLSAAGLPSGVTAAFSPASISGSSTSTVTFTATPVAVAGGPITVTITGTSGSLVRTATCTLTVASNPILTTVKVTPNTVSLNVNGSQQFTASGYDQFGNVLASQPSFVWSLASGGVGSVSTAGLYSAGPATGSATVTAAAGTVTGTASVSVLAAAPPAPSGLRAVPSSSKVVLYWNAVSGATGYNVYRSTTEGAEGSVPSTASAAIHANGALGVYYTDTGLAPNTSYYYQVTALAGSSESAKSNEAEATTGGAVPSAPAGLTAAAGAGSVTLQWSPVSGAASYDLFRSVSGGGAVVYQVGLTGSSYIDTGVTPGVTYSYFLTAVNAAGEGAASSTVSVTVGAPSFSLSAAPLATSVAQGSTAGSVVSLVNANGFSSSVALTVSNLPAGVTASFSPASISGSLASTMTFSATPTSASIGPVTVTIAGTSASLVRTATCTLTVASNPILTTVKVTPNTVSLNVNGSQQFTASGYDQFGNVLASQPSFVWSLASGGVGSVSTAGLYSAGPATGSATVTAAAGTVTGTASVSVLAAAPPAPSGLRAVPSSSKVVLYWNAVSGATGYNVYRCTTEGAEGSVPSTASAAIHANGALGVYYTDTGLAPNTSYYYQVTAVIGSSESAKSNEAEATTGGAVPSAPAGLTATAGAGSVTLQWSPVSGAASYDLFRSVSGSGAVAYQVGLTGSSYIDTGVTPGVTYSYFLTAVNAAGEGAASSSASAKPTSG